jgi:ParB family chromosome partitioning protein
VREMMAGEMWELEINKIRPNCRLVYEEEVILRLCDDIKARGLQEPILVELVECWFQIIDGEKRWRACKKLGLNRIRAVIQEASLP